MNNSNNSCRLCLNIVENEDLYPLFTAKTEHNFEFEWRRIFSFIYYVDGLPNSICRCCKDQVVWILNFQKRCHENDFNLKTIMETKPQNIQLDDSDKPIISNEQSVGNEPGYEMFYEDERNENDEPGCADHESSDATFIVSIDMDQDVDEIDNSENINDSEDYEATNVIDENERGLTSSEQSLVLDNIDINKKKKSKNSNRSKRRGTKAKSNREYSCSICGKLFSNAGNLNRHSNIHTGDQVFWCTAKGCDKKFFQKIARNDHYNIEHMGLIYKCPICGNLQKSYCNASRHASKKHPDEMIRSILVKK